MTRVITSPKRNTFPLGALFFIIEIQYGFNTLGLEKIIATVDHPNSASIKVLEKIGLTFEKDDEIIEPRDGLKVAVKCFAIYRK